MTSIIHIGITLHFLLQLLLLSFLSFATAMILTPLYTHFAYKYHWWKKPRTDAWSGGKALVYQKLHAEKHKKLIPTMAGVIFVISVLLVTVFYDLSRGETWLPLAGLIGAGLIGLIDDSINIRSNGSGVAGMQARYKFILYSLVSLVGGWWFYYKLGVSTIFLPGLGHVGLGILIIPLFWLVVIATSNAVNISDGLDGLAGGLLTSSFSVYGLISVFEHKYQLAIFCFVIVGALLSYTWFNIFPARFYMGDVGSFALGTALGIVAMQTDTVYLLPIIGIVYVAETGSVIINRVSKKLRNGKKVFLSSPIHHHFEAIGWPETKVTMRFWIVGQVAAVIGLIIFLINRI